MPGWRPDCFRGSVYEPCKYMFVLKSLLTFTIPRRTVGTVDSITKCYFGVSSVGLLYELQKPPKYPVHSCCLSVQFCNVHRINTRDNIDDLLSVAVISCRMTEALLGWKISHPQRWATWRWRVQICFTPDMCILAICNSLNFRLFVLQLYLWGNMTLCNDN